MYASSISMRVSGELRFTRRTKRSTAAALCAVPVGLFGLQKNTMPAPLAASAIASRSSASERSTGTIVIPAPIRRAVESGVPYVGATVTSGFSAEQNARTPASRMPPDPVAMMTLSRSTP